MNDESNEPDSRSIPIRPLSGDDKIDPSAAGESDADDVTAFEEAAGISAENAPIHVPYDSSEELEPSASPLDDEMPVMASLIDADESSVRTGSPFASDPLVPVLPHRVELVIDGPLRYTASGAVAAAAMVLAFAAAAAWWFPSGGTMIAALGCVLSIFGLYSAHRVTAASMLSLHLGLFILCYGRSISSQ